MAVLKKTGALDEFDAWTAADDLDAMLKKIAANPKFVARSPSVRPQ
jgi:hypothetical protein